MQETSIASPNKWKILLYLLVAALAAGYCINENLPYYLEGPFAGFLAFFRDTQVTNASKSITFDVLGLYFLSIVWMWQGSRNIGRQYFLLGFLASTWIAVAVGLPLFLAIKEYLEPNSDLA